MSPCVLHEDEHLLVVHKPPGWNTHAPSPYAGEGIYDWLRHREPRWAALATIHRLDKETSGVMVFSKTALANRSLTEQFARHTVRKRYLLLTDRAVDRDEFVAESWLVRVGERYVSRPKHAGGDRAETCFRVVERQTDRTLVEALPVTGRTHQIRVHAAENGFPILGDALYAGTPAPRLFLRADAITLKHPVSGETVTFQSPSDFSADPRLELRAGVIDGHQTTAFRLVHGASDGWPGWYVDRLGDWLLSQSEQPLTPEQIRELERLQSTLQSSSLSHPPSPLRGAYHKLLRRDVRQTVSAEASPQLVVGEAAPDQFTILENGLRFELSLSEGYSVGLFLDQRDNRRRFLVNHIAAGFPLFPSGAAGAEVLNTFAYTCGFSVCAAQAGARVTSLDLSRKYLEWGRRNLALNGLEPAQHDFIYGEAFGWLRRLAKKGRAFDTIILDPPTFSQAKESGVFRAEKDYGKLVTAALPLLKPGGVLLASTNAATFKPEEFVQIVEAAATAAGRVIRQRHYVPQPPDFPISRAEPGYLKTLWLRIDSKQERITS
jgi:23S rRNA (cytosine1962-C5)-methyltransferase